MPIALTLAVLLAASANAAAPVKPQPFVVGETLQMESRVLAETRTYIIHTPASYKSGKDRYPVLVLQDGESNFAHTVAAVDLLADNGRIPEMIVVGVNNTDRSRDMTPTRPATGWGGTPWSGSAGGADKFLAFIADELLPAVDRDYRTRPYRILVGHSLGGLFAIYALTTRPEVFNGYLAISPSLWWDDQALVKKAQPFFAVHPQLRADLYMTMGDEGQAMLGGAWKLAAVLEESKLKDVRWQFKRSVEEDHGTIPYLSTYEGLQAIFSGYRITDPVALYDQGGTAALDRHYAEFSRRLGYPIKVPESLYHVMMWRLGELERFSDAEVIGKQALALEPRDASIHSTLAELAGMQKDTPRAIAHLTEALRLYPGNTDTRKALADYKVDVNSIVPDTRLSSRQLAPYLGTYRFNDELIKVAYEKDVLTASGTIEKCELRPVSPTRFYCVDVDLEIGFDKDAGGRVVGLTAEYPDRTDQFRRVR